MFDKIFFTIVNFSLEFQAKDCNIKLVNAPLLGEVETYYASKGNDVSPLVVFPENELVCAFLINPK